MDPRQPRHTTDAGAAVASFLDLDDLLRRAASYASESVGTEASSILLHDAESHEFVVAAASGPTGDRMRGRRFPDTAGIAGAVLRSGKPCIVPEVRGGQGRSLSEIDRAADAVVRSLMAAPLKVEDRTFGVIEAVNRIVKIGFGIMGGFNQAQAHAQFVSDIVDFGLDVQQSLEVGRFTKATFSGCDVDVEALVPEATRQALAAMGHQVRTIPPRSGTFGYGQAVMSDGACVHFAGSEPRPDGAAIPEGPKVFKGGEK